MTPYAECCRVIETGTGLEVARTTGRFPAAYCAWSPDRRWLAIGAASMAGGQAAVFVLRFLRCVAADSLELKGTARLLSTVLAGPLLLRGLLLMVGGVALPLVAGGPLIARDQAIGSGGAAQAVMAAALICALVSEMLERYLFFVSVVPRHMTAPYIAPASEVA